MELNEYAKGVLADFVKECMDPLTDHLTEVAQRAEGHYREDRQEDDGDTSQGWQLASLFLHKLLREARSLQAAMNAAAGDGGADDFVTGAPYQQRR